MVCKSAKVYVHRVRAVEVQNCVEEFEVLEGCSSMHKFQSPIPQQLNMSFGAKDWYHMTSIVYSN